jgi:hypothetical protein
VALVVTPSSFALYIDGQSNAKGAASAHSDLKGFHLMDARALTGVLDEVRVSNVARSADWVALEWRSARPGFMSVGEAQTLH